MESEAAPSWDPAVHPNTRSTVLSAYNYHSRFLRPLSHVEMSHQNCVHCPTLKCPIRTVSHKVWITETNEMPLSLTAYLILIFNITENHKTKIFGIPVLQTPVITMRPQTGSITSETRSLELKMRYLSWAESSGFYNHQREQSVRCKVRALILILLAALSHSTSQFPTQFVSISGYLLIANSTVQSLKLTCFWL